MSDDKIDDGGPVFSLPSYSYQRHGDSYHVEAESGLSRRDWFATFAPPITEAEFNSEILKDKQLNHRNDPGKPRWRSRVEITTDLAFAYADAMIAASKRQPR